MTKQVIECDVCGTEVYNDLDNQRDYATMYWSPDQVLECRADLCDQCMGKMVAMLDPTALAAILKIATNMAEDNRVDTERMLAELASEIAEVASEDGAV